MSGVEALLGGAAILLLPTILYIWVVWIADRNEKEPFVDIALAVVGGAVIAPLIAIGVERLLGLPDSVYPSKLAQIPFDGPNFGGAIVEEIAKGAVVLGLFVLLPREFDNVMDGIVYGTVVGAGFVLAENAAYLLDLARLQSAVTLSPAFFGVVLIGGLSQCVFSAVFGASLGVLREGSGPAGRLVWVPVVGFLLAALYHLGHLAIGRLAAQNAPLAILSLAADWAGLGLLAIVVAWAWHHEASIIHAMLADEVSSGAVTTGELALLGTTGARTANELHAFGVGGFRGYRLTRQLHQAQVELAFRKWHLANNERLKGGQRDTTEDEYRGQIRALRSRLNAELARTGPARG
jgi:RsiW-degrading membrane proteinase PrsW (M82 family)